MAQEKTPSVHKLLAAAYRREAKAMMAVAMLYLPASEAQDAVHDVFLKFYRNEHLLALPDGELRLVLLKSVKNYCANAIRHNDVMRRHNSRAMMTFLQDTIDQNDYMRQCNVNLRRIAVFEAQLPEKRREVFRMYYHDGLSIQQIAEMLLISRRTVENNLYRALAWIREQIKQR